MESQASPADRLRTFLAECRRDGRCETIPACHDALTAQLISRAGFQCSFMSGFAVSASHLAAPDAGLISYGEQVDVGRKICEATHGKLLIIGDGDTGFGSSANVRRAIRGYALAGFAGISIEDQTFPKRCSYALGLQVESRERAIARVEAAVAARTEMRKEGLDLVIIGRTDCRNAAENGGLDEAIERCRAFARLGCEIVYAEGLQSRAEMQMLNAAMRDEGAPYTLLAQVDKAGASVMPAGDAAQEGYTLRLLGLTVLGAAMRGVMSALETMRLGEHPEQSSLVCYEEMCEEVGFPKLYEWEGRFGKRQAAPSTARPEH